MERAPLHVEVVSADRPVWSGDSLNVIARTVEGDIGILPGHEPLMALLVPTAVEIVTVDGRSETIAVDGGCLSVTNGRVSILAEEAHLGHEVSLDEARHQAAALESKALQGHANDDELHHLRILQAQILAGEAYASRKSGS